MFPLLVTVLLLVSMTASAPTVGGNPDHWSFKVAPTISVSSQLTIACSASPGDQIWIGWSHYGTKAATTAAAAAAAAASTSSHFKTSNKKQQQQQPLLSVAPEHTDCWMNFTEKIAEQCNGAERCDLSAQPTYIHKCGATSDYLYVAYKCVRARDTFDICQPAKRTIQLRRSASQTAAAAASPAFYIKSSEFPDEYSSSLDCACALTRPTQSAKRHHQHSLLRSEVLWFALQDGDSLSTSVNSGNLSGWLSPASEMTLGGGGGGKPIVWRFRTDDALAYKGFWLKISERRRACAHDWTLVGEQCVKVFDERVEWRAAMRRCQQHAARLVKLADVVDDLKLTQHVRATHPHMSSYWLGLRKYVDERNRAVWMWSSGVNATVYADVSWWPWRSTLSSTEGDNTNSNSNSNNNNCVVKKRDEDGYFTVGCDPLNKHAFICQTDMIDMDEQSPSNSDEQADDDVTLECGPSELVLAHQQQQQQQQAQVVEATEQPHATSVQPQSWTSTIAFLVEAQTTAPVPPTPILSALPSEPKSALQGDARASSVSSSPSSSFSTTMVAGLLTAIGLLILAINIVVLLVCKRQWKRLHASSSSSHHHHHHDLHSGGGGPLTTSPAANHKSETTTMTTATTSTPSPNLLLHSTSSTNHDILKEYIDAFNTMHHQHQHHHQMSNNKNKAQDILTCAVGTTKPLATHACDDASSLLHDASSHLFSSFHHHQQHQHQQQHPHTLYRGDMLRQSANSSSNSSSSNSAASGFRMLNSNNQYDRMNRAALNINNNNNNNNQDEAAEDQYAHTYECLDDRFRHVTPSAHMRQPFVRHQPANDSLAHQQPTANYDLIGNMLINSSSTPNRGDTNGSGELVNMSSTSSSCSTSSTGASSTCSQQHQHQQQQQQQQVQSSFNPRSSSIVTDANFQLLPPGNRCELVALNVEQIKQLQAAAAAAAGGNTGNTLNTHPLVLCSLTSNGDLILNSGASGCNNAAGSWSPDSAYYTAIPIQGALNTATLNYNASTFNNMSRMLAAANAAAAQQHQQHQQQQQQQQQHTVRSHLV